MEEKDYRRELSALNRDNKKLEDEKLALQEEKNIYKRKYEEIEVQCNELLKNKDNCEAKIQACQKKIGSLTTAKDIALAALATANEALKTSSITLLDNFTNQILHTSEVLKKEVDNSS